MNERRICVDALRPTQYLFNYIETIFCLAGLNQY